AGLASVGGCRDDPEPIPPAPNVGSQATGIDIHAHVFNARDIPISGFVTQVVLEGRPLGQLALGPLAVLLSLIMDESAWTPEREAAGLESGRIQPFEAQVSDVQSRVSEAVRK